MAKDSVFENPYYRRNKILLSSIGVWPEQSLFMRCLLPIIIFVTLMSVLIPEVIRIPEVRHDFDNLMECLPPLTVMGMSFTQLFNGSFNRQKIQEMLDRITVDWKRLNKSPNVEIIHKYAAHGRLITMLYYNLLAGITIFYLIVPLWPIILDVIIPLNESRKRNYLFEAEYGVNPDDYYWPIMAHAYITSIFSLQVIVVCDVLFFAMVEHACALFEIVGVNLSMVRETVAKGGPEKRNDYEMICYCIDLHKDAIVFADLIEDSYSTSFMGVIALCLIMLSLSGVQTIMHLDQPEVLLRFGSFCVAQIVHLYFISAPGQKLMDHSLSVFERAYTDNWDGLSLRAQKLLIMIMMRSLKQCQITAGKVYVMSMENYSSVMQTAMSYFTVLSSMR